MTESAEQCQKEYPPMTDIEFEAVQKVLPSLRAQALDPTDPEQLAAGFVYTLARKAVEREYLRRSEGATDV